MWSQCVSVCLYVCLCVCEGGGFLVLLGVEDGSAVTDSCTLSESPEGICMRSMFSVVSGYVRALCIVRSCCVFKMVLVE